MTSLPLISGSSPVCAVKTHDFRAAYEQWRFSSRGGLEWIFLRMHDASQSLEWCGIKTIKTIKIIKTFKTVLPGRWCVAVEVRTVMGLTTAVMRRQRTMVHLMCCRGLSKARAGVRSSVAFGLLGMICQWELCVCRGGIFAIVMMWLGRGVSLSRMV